MHMSAEDAGVFRDLLVLLDLLTNYRVSRWLYITNRSGRVHTAAPAQE